MFQYLIRRLLHGLLVIFGVLVVVFVLIRLGGDPVLQMVPEGTTKEEIAQYRQLLGFDRPLYEQFANYMLHAAQGDFGNSLRHRQPALPLLLERLPATLKLAGVAMAFAVAIGIPIGILAALKRDSILDAAGMATALLGQSVPSFWMGLMLIFVFAVGLRWFPPSGTGSWQHLVLPGFTLGAYSTALNARLLRSSLLEVMGLDYVRTARAKGLTERLVVVRHALKNALIPVVTAFGLQMGFLLSGAVITEQVFAYPGVGRLAVQAIYARDYPVVQAFVMMIATIVVAVNIAVDLVYGYLDPRIRYR
jgi:peptide/nickel transport system permease protein